MLFSIYQSRFSRSKKVKEKSREWPQSQTAPLPRSQKEEETDKSKQALIRNVERGQGVWKMNVSTIKSKNFRESLECFWPIWAASIDESEHILTWWEIMKYKIKQLSIETSRYLNLSKRTVYKYEQRINDIKDTSKHLEKQELMYLKQKVREYYDQQLSALKIRARIKYFEEKEKSTFFFSIPRKRTLMIKYEQK